MGKVVNLSDYRKPKVDINVGKIDSKKACELLDERTLLALSLSKERVVSIDGEMIELEVNDILNELDSRE